MNKLGNSQERGFTIVELMIATAVLSTLLVVVSIMMANIGKLYYKGITQAKMQDNTRSVVDEVADRLQLNNSNPPVIPDSGVGGVKSYCVGTTRYTYIENIRVTDDPPTPSTPSIKHVLWRDTVPVGTCGVANLALPTPSANGSELLTTKSRITQFTISPVTSPFRVTLGLAYGDDDQITGSGTNTRCISQSGNQFCATSSLSTQVVQRVTGSN